MDDFLGKGEYLRGKQEIKTLRLSADKRQMLLNNLKELKIVNGVSSAEEFKKIAEQFL